MMSVWEKRGDETDEQRISVRFVFFQGYTWNCLLLFAVNNVIVRELVPSLPYCLLCCISYDKLTKNIPIKIGHTPFASHWLSIVQQGYHAMLFVYTTPQAGMPVAILTSYL
jgi:hypothetical protein